MTPRGGRDGVEGWGVDRDGRPLLRIRVAAAAADGAANASAVVLIAKALKVPKSAVRIVGGEIARVKRLEIDGVTAQDLDRAFGPR